MKKLLSPGRIIALGFLTIILIGTLLLLLPISQKQPGSICFTDALFVSTSAVCVTGLSTVDPGSVLTGFGQTVLAILIQLGGLGFATISMGIVMLAGHKIFLKQRTLVKESLNYSSMGGIVPLLKSVFAVTLIIECVGALLSFTVFIKDYPFFKALGLSFFHSVSSFNNAGFDILGLGNSLISYNGNIALNLITCFVVISGGIGYLVIKELAFKHSFKKLTLHTKIVITVTAALLIVGTVLLKLTEGYTLLDAFFMSMSTRTAGFTVVPLDNISNAGLVVYVILMFIGASPTSTGGGIKTTTFFVILTALYSYVSSSKPSVFKRTLPKDILHKAFIILAMGLAVCILSLFSLSLAQPDIPINDLLLEVVSAFATVGLSTGITPTLSAMGKYIIIVTMFIGRLGPLTIASLCGRNRYPGLKERNQIMRKKKKNLEIYGVIGLGRFGFNLAKNLCEMGREVIVLDNDPKKLKEIAEYTDNAFLIEEINKETLTETGITTCDTVIVGIGETIDTGILATLTVIQMGVKKVIAKAITAEQGYVLEKLGAEVVYPEKDMAVRLAKRLVSPQTMEYISLSEEIDITEISLTQKVDMITVSRLDIRKKYGLNIIAIKHGESILTEITPDTVLHTNDNIVVIGKRANIEKFENYLS